MGHYKRDQGFPDWYRLEKYSATQQFKASDWLAALRIRKNILDVIKGFETAGLALSYVYQIMPDIQIELAALRKSPLDNSVCPSWADIAGDFSDNSLLLPIREMRLSDIVRFQQEAVTSVENGQREFNPWEELEKWPNLPEEVREASLANQEQHIEPLLVDMRATNSVLIKAFETWLKKSRAQRKGSSKQKKPSYTFWARYGLLPYLDLLIWRLEERVRRSSDEMADAVGYSKSNENFQKTVVALGRRLMKDLGELEALAAEEEHFS